MHKHSLESQMCLLTFSTVAGISGIPSVTEVIDGKSSSTLANGQHAHGSRLTNILHKIYLFVGNFASNRLTCSSALWSLSSLEPVTVEPHIPIRKLLDETNQSRNHCVQAVRLHLRVDKLREQAQSIN